MSMSIRERASRRTSRRRSSPGGRALALLLSMSLAGGLMASTAESARAIAVATSRTATHTSASSGCTNAQQLHGWRIHRLVEQTIVVPVDEGDVAAATQEVGGVILFGSRAPQDLGARLRELTSLAPAGIAPIVMTDEEGGTVQRMANLVGSLPTARYMGRHWRARRIRRGARRLAVRMRDAGVTMDLAPVLDLDGRAGPNADDAIGTRSFSARRSVATPDGLAFARGLRAAGVVPVVKHFPGIGGADGNTDLGAASTPPWRRVQANDLRPFSAAVAAGLPAVMVSNARVPGLTPEPASLSRAVVHRVLRHRLGFHGLVLPDSLTAGAVSAAGFSLRAAAVRGIAVGEDVVLFNATANELASTTRGVVRALLDAVSSGRLPRTRLESAVGHLLRAKGVDLCSTG